MTRFERVVRGTSLVSMRPWVLRRLLLTVGVGLLVGVAGGLLTFFYYRTAAFAAATDVPQWLLMALAFLSGATIHPFGRSLSITTWGTIVAVLVSLPVYYVTWLYPFLTMGYSTNTVLAYFTYYLGGKGLFAWAYFYPVVMSVGVLMSVLVDEFGPD